MRAKRQSLVMFFVGAALLGLGAFGYLRVFGQKASGVSLTFSALTEQEVGKPLHYFCREIKDQDYELVIKGTQVEILPHCVEICSGGKAWGSVAREGNTIVLTEHLSLIGNSWSEYLYVEASLDMSRFEPGRYEFIAQRESNIKGMEEKLRTFIEIGPSGKVNRGN